MTAKDYIDEFMDYVVERYQNSENRNDPDELDIRIFCEEEELVSDFITEKTSRDYVDAFACYDLIRELEFTEWKSYKEPQNIWDVARIALTEVFEDEDSDDLYRRCTDKINEAQED